MRIDGKSRAAQQLEMMGSKIYETSVCMSVWSSNIMAYDYMFHHSHHIPFYLWVCNFRSLKLYQTWYQNWVDFYKNLNRLPINEKRKKKSNPDWTDLIWYNIPQSVASQHQKLKFFINLLLLQQMINIISVHIAILFLWRICFTVMKMK